MSMPFILVSLGTISYLFALEALNESGFFSADVSTGTAVNEHVEVVS